MNKQDFGIELRFYFSQPLKYLPVYLIDFSTPTTLNAWLSAIESKNVDFVFLMIFFSPLFFME